MGRQGMAPDLAPDRSLCPRAWSRVKPVLGLHLGNHLGQLRHCAERQHQGELFVMLADLPSGGIDGPEPAGHQQTLATAAELLAVGIEPSHAAIFVASGVPCQAAIAWLLADVVKVAMLRDVVGAAGTPGDLSPGSIGALLGPIAFAAGVLAYRADEALVPSSQRRYVDFARDAGARINEVHGRVLRLPVASTPVVRRQVMDLQEPTRPMSAARRGSRGRLDLTDSDSAAVRKIHQAVTDSGREVDDRALSAGVANLVGIASAVRRLPFEEGLAIFAGWPYARLKAAVADLVVEELAPIRVRLHEMLASEDYVGEVLRQGTESASAEAMRTLGALQQVAGFGIDAPPARHQRRQIGGSREVGT